jgi:hypothetical protein
MDLQVAIFLLIFLSISSLATIGICFVELRSCWRNYRSRNSTKQRNEAAAAALGLDNNEFAAACLAAAAAAEESVIAPMTGAASYSSHQGSNSYYYQDYNSGTTSVGLPMASARMGPAQHGMPYPLLDPEAGGFDLLYDEYGGHLLLNDENGEGRGGIDGASSLLRENIYSGNIHSHGLAAPI